VLRTEGLKSRFDDLLPLLPAVGGRREKRAGVMRANAAAKVNLTK
jgi:hypothetical protein